MQTNQKKIAPKFYLQSGNKLKTEGQLDRAIEEYQKALQLNPNFVPALAQLAEIYQTQTKIDLAIDCLNKLIQLKPEKNKFIRQLVILYSQVFLKTNDLNNAISTYDELIKRSSLDRTVIHEKLGEVIVRTSLRKGQFEPAINFFKKEIEAQPNNPWLYYNLGLNLAKCDRQSEAIDCYQAAIKLDPSFWKAFIECAELLNQNGDRDRAWEYQIKALQIEPNLPRKYAKLINARSPEECKLLKQIIQENIEKEKAENVKPAQYFQSGKKLAKQGEFTEAISYYQKCIFNQLRQNNPTFVNQYWNQGILQDPNCLIIGVAKCGTTSLYNYLCQHPQFLSCIQKEPHYLITLASHFKTVTSPNTWPDLKGEKNFYLAHFPPRPTDYRFITGESSVSSIYPGVEKLVYNWFPNIKLIAILREPVKRVISHYNEDLKENRPKYSLEETIRMELEQLNPMVKADRGDLIFQRGRAKILVPSLYIYILERWMKLFPREQFLILSNEDLAQDPAGVMKQVFEFLGLPEDRNINYTPRNVGNYPKDIDPDLIARLQDFYRPYNQRLEEFLGRKFNWD